MRQPRREAAASPPLAQGAVGLASNPRISLPATVSACAFAFLVVYGVSLLLEYTRADAWVATQCSAARWEAVTRPCQASPSTLCFTCRYYVTALSRSGSVPLVGFTDIAGSFAMQSGAFDVCRATAASPFPCYYQPAGNPNVRFVVALTAPAATTSIAPVVVCGLLTFGCALAACGGATAAALKSRDVALERMYAAARARAAMGWEDDAAPRWTDREGGAGGPPLGQPRAPAGALSPLPPAGAPPGVRSSPRAGATAPRASPGAGDDDAGAVNNPFSSERQREADRGREADRQCALSRARDELELIAMSASAASSSRSLGASSSRGLGGQPPRW